MRLLLRQDAVAHRRVQNFGVRVITEFVLYLLNGAAALASLLLYSRSDRCVLQVRIATKDDGLRYYTLRATTTVISSAAGAPSEKEATA